MRAWNPLQALLCLASGEALASRRRRILAGVAPALARAQLAAAVFDYVENTSLLLILSGRDGRLPALARRAALVKFALSSAGLGYLLLGGAAGLQGLVRR